jgi:uncharacterized protein (TIGR03435 family)
MEEGMRHFSGKVVLVLTAMAIAVMPVVSQTPPAQKALSFEVASVKVNQSGNPMAVQYLPNGRFFARDIPIPLLILEAYNSPRLFQTKESGFSSIQSERYDIEALAGKDAIPAGSSAKARNDTIRLMLQTLLADRFKLIVQRVRREQPVYTIVIAKNGPKLQKAVIQESDCADSSTNFADPTSCHVFAGGQGRGLNGQAVDMSDLATALSRFADRPVLDKTGLGGLYKIETVGWVPLLERPARPAGQEASAEDLALADPSRPTLYAVLNELGLKLEAQTANVEVIVVDHIERPTEN